jgi:hypothetical protein
MTQLKPYKSLFVGMVLFIIHALTVYLVPSFYGLKLILLVYLFFFSWNILYITIFNKINAINPKWTINAFMLLTTIKLLFSGILILVINSFFNYPPPIIIIHFFIPFFVFLVLQVNYSVKLLR